MEKNDFLDRIARGLAARGLAANTVNKYVRRVGELLDELSNEERAAILSHDVNIEAFVDDLLRGSEDEAKSAPARREAKPAQRAEAKPEAKKNAPRTEQKPAQKTARPSSEMKRAEPKSAPAPKKADTEEKKKTDRAERAERAPTEEVPIPKKKRKSAPEMDASKDYTRFWTVFWLTSPVWALLLIAGALLFAFMIVTFAAMSVAFVALLIVAVVLGLALALVGVIYGTVQLFGELSLPVGLFELGQGIFIGGLATVLGVLFYNLSVRFSPWLIKQTGRMFVSSLRWVKEIFYVVRGALAK